MPLLNELPNLLEIYLMSYSPAIEAVTMIIRRHQKLVKFHFMGISISNEDVNAFQEKFGNNGIRGYGANAELHFERFNALN